MTKLEMFMNADGSVSIYGFFVKAVVDQAFEWPIPFSICRKPG